MFYGNLQCIRHRFTCNTVRHYTRRSTIINEDLLKRLKYYENENPTAYSIEQFVNYSQERSTLYNLVRKEIPVRISRVITQLPHYFPSQVYHQRTAQFIQDYFEMTFKEIERLPENIDVIDSKTESRFLETLVRGGIRLSGTTEMLSEALITSNIVNNEEDVLSIQSNLRKLFHQNLSIDVLVNVYKPKWTKKINNSTCIDTANSIIDNIETAYEDARYLCEQHYINAPELQIETKSTNIVFSYIPSHLYLVFFEIFKNSLRATCEYHEDTENLPPIIVSVSRDDREMKITVQDHGGGMSQDKLQRSQLFFSTSAVLDNMSLYQGAHSSPLAGYGFGIGMVEIYTKYFGGSINIFSEEGNGTSIALSFPSDSSLAVENLLCF